MNSETVQKYARIALYWVAGALTSHGIISKDATWIEPVIGVVLTLVNFAWTMYGGRLAGLLAQVQGNPAVIATSVVIDSSKADPAALNASTPSGVVVK